MYTFCFAVGKFEIKLFITTFKYFQDSAQQQFEKNEKRRKKRTESLVTISTVILWVLHQQTFDKRFLRKQNNFSRR